MARVKIIFSEASYKAATARGRTIARRPSAIVAAEFDAESDSILLTMKNGVKIALPRKKIWELKRATPKQLAELIVSPLRDSISFPAIDADIHTFPLLKDLLFDPSEFARVAGSTTSPAKAAAARKNGRKGGRPPKKKIAA